MRGILVTLLITDKHIDCTQKNKWNQNGASRAPFDRPLNGATFQKGTVFTLFWCPWGNKMVPFLLKKALLFKMVPQWHCFSTLFSWLHSAKKYQL